MNDDEITEMMHNAYIINCTDNHDGFSFDEFYNIVTKKSAWFRSIIFLIIFII